jgi:hypothetical protein
MQPDLTLVVKCANFTTGLIDHISLDRRMIPVLPLRASKINTLAALKFLTAPSPDVGANRLLTALLRRTAAKSAL